MSWLARSIANTLKLDDEEDDNNHNETDNYNNSSDKSKDEHRHLIDDLSPTSPSRGVKEDLSELTKTLTRQFWGVASFLAPPSQVSHSDQSHEPSGSGPDGSDPAGITGVRNDIAEIGGRFRSGISKLSGNIAVTEITKMASNFLQFGVGEDDYESVTSAVGVTEEVVAFVRDIAMHPETWLDFPLAEDEDDEEFDMSDAQQEHALSVERLAPKLAVLRIELCPGYMSEGCFWKIYFVLLHPRLDRHDAELLSTPQIVKARALLTQELQNRNMAKSEQQWFRSRTSYSTGVTNSPHEQSLYVPSACQTESPLATTTLESANSTVAAYIKTEKNPVLCTEIPIVDKSVIEEGPMEQEKDQNLHSGSFSNVLEQKDEDDGDDWLKEESSEIVTTSGNNFPIENEEDLSFSDLEDDDDDDDGDVPISYKKVTYCSDSSTKDSRDWVQLSRSSTDSIKDNNSVTTECAGSEQTSAHNSESKESNDWLNLDDIDVA